MTDKPTLNDLLAADPADLGCDAGFEILDQYVELELAGQDANAHFPGLAIHIHSCPDCRLDYEGMLDAVRADR